MNSNIYLFYTAVDCGDLSDPLNGVVTYASTTFTTGLAIYECNENYTLNGNLSRICQADGSWSGVSPVCDGEFITIMGIVKTHTLLETELEYST